MKIRIVVVLQSVLCSILEIIVYPWIVNKVRVPIPYLATFGMFFEAICYYGMAALPTELGCMIACSLLWVGFCSAAPTSVSILSVYIILNLSFIDYYFP